MWCSNCGKEGHLVGRCSAAKKNVLDKVLHKALKASGKVVDTVVVPKDIPQVCALDSNPDCPVCAARRKKETARKRKWRKQRSKG